MIVTVVVYARCLESTKETLELVEGEPGASLASSIFRIVSAEHLHLT